MTPLEEVQKFLPGAGEIYDPCTEDAFAADIEHSSIRLYKTNGKWDCIVSLFAWSCASRDHATAWDAFFHARKRALGKSDAFAATSAALRKIVDEQDDDDEKRAASC